MSACATDARYLLLALPLLLCACSMGGGSTPATPVAARTTPAAPASATARGMRTASAGEPAAAVSEGSTSEASTSQGNASAADGPGKPRSEPARPVPAAPRPAAAAGPFDAARAGLSISSAGWRTRRRDKALVYEGRMRVPSIALFESTRGKTLEDTVEQLSAELGGALGSVRITSQAKATTVAGYRAFVAEGTGKAEGFPMRWRATVVEAERRTIILGLAPSFFWGGNVGKIHAFERGLRKASPPAGVVQTAALPARRTEAR